MVTAGTEGCHGEGTRPAEQGKKKPKSDKNKKPKHAPFGGKTPPAVTAGMQSVEKK